MSVWLWKKKRIKMVPIKERVKTNEGKPELVAALEPFFQLCLDNRGKGIEITEYKNPLTGEVDLTSINLDLRVMRYTAEVNAESAVSSDGATSP
jgi:hypothetical protein